jgi:hypothetical protein
MHARHAPHRPLAIVMHALPHLMNVPCFCMTKHHCIQDLNHHFNSGKHATQTCRRLCGVPLIRAISKGPDAQDLKPSTLSCIQSCKYVCSEGWVCCPGLQKKQRHTLILTVGEPCERFGTSSMRSQERITAMHTHQQLVGICTHEAVRGRAPYAE